LPSLNNVAVWVERDVLIFVVAVNVPATGSNNSAVAVGTPVASRPPVTRIFPLGSSVAVCDARAVPILPVGEKLPFVALKISAVARVLPLFNPPITTTLPSTSTVAVCE
jgi:hypothetical protein